MNSKIIVFGGAGFIGSHLLRRLSEETPHELVSVDIRPPGSAVPGVDYIHQDVRDLSQFDLPGEIHKIYNLAAVHTTPGHPEHEYYETNIAGATEITAFARRKGVQTLIFTSSISVYGPGEDTKSETSPIAPASAYGWSKWLAEKIHRSWLSEEGARKLIITRPAVVFGPGEGGNFTRLAKLMKKGFFVYPGRKETIKACFYVDDLIDAVFFAEAQTDRYALFNGCYPDRYTLEAIVEAFKADHFPALRTVLFPRLFVTAAAHLLRPLSPLGLGIHPDRVTKLVRSTDVVPGWLSEKGHAQENRLPHALDRWANDSDGRFD